VNDNAITHTRECCRTVYFYYFRSFYDAKAVPLTQNSGDATVINICITCIFKMHIDNVDVDILSVEHMLLTADHSISGKHLILNHTR